MHASIARMVDHEVLGRETSHHKYTELGRLVNTKPLVSVKTPLRQLTVDSKWPNRRSKATNSKHPHDLFIGLLDGDFSVRATVLVNAIGRTGRRDCFLGQDCLVRHGGR